MKGEDAMGMRNRRGVWVFWVLVGLMGGIILLHRRPSAEELVTHVGLWSTVAAAVLLHEGGHGLMAACLGVRMRKLRPELFGARLELEGVISYPREWWVAAGGPLANLLSAAVVYPWAARGEEWALWFFGASAVLGAVNLLPVKTLDGGRMLTCAAAWLWGDGAAVTLVGITTGITTGLLWMLSVYALLRAEQMLSLFAFSLCLLWRVIRGDKV